MDIRETESIGYTSVLVEPFKTSLWEPGVGALGLCGAGERRFKGTINRLWVAARKIITDSDVNPLGE